MLNTALALMTLAQASADSNVVVAPPPPTAVAAEKALGADLTQLQRIFEVYGIPALKAIILLILGFIVAGWISRIVRRTCERAHLDATLAKFLSSMIRWAVLAAVIIMCLSSFGVQVTSLVALLGTIGVAIGLALQGSLSHIASGVMLLIFRPFKVGDFVTAGGQSGVIDEISLFSTILITPDNRKIIVPNGAIVGGVIINATALDSRVAEITVAADAGGAIDVQRQVLGDAARAVQGRLSDKDPGVALASTTATHNWAVSVWCKTSDLDAVRERLLIACNAAAAKNGIAPQAPVTLVKNL